MNNNFYQLVKDKNWQKYCIVDSSQETLICNQMPHGATFYFSAFFLQQNTNFLLILPNDREAKQFSEEIRFFLPPKCQPIYVPEISTSMATQSSGSNERRLWLDQLQALDRLSSKNGLQIVVCSIRSALAPFPDFYRRRQNKITLEIGNQFSPQDLIARLQHYGYQRVMEVEIVGDIALKGSVLDLICPDQALRMNFDDENIEAIRELDVSDQRSYGSLLSTVQILPMYEYLLNTEDCQKIATKQMKTKPQWLMEILDKYRSITTVKDKKQEELTFPVTRQQFQEIAAYLDPEKTLFELIAKKSIVHFLYYKRIVMEIHNKETQGLNSMLQTKDVQICLFDKYAQNIDDSSSKDLPQYNSQLNGIHENTHLLNGSLSQKIQSIADFFNQSTSNVSINKKPTVIIFSKSDNLNSLAALFTRYQDQFSCSILDKKASSLSNLQPGGLYIACIPLTRGFYVPSICLLCLTDQELLGDRAKSLRKIRSQNLSPIGNRPLFDLDKGDYVVHLVHGIGKFEKLKRITTQTTMNEYMVILYANDSRLFVPIDQISMVQKYVSGITKPALDTLGKGSFRKKRQKLEPMIHEFAKRIIHLQAYRNHATGFVCSDRYANFEQEFVNRFPFEETNDQLRALQAIYDDLSSGKCMDRLLCGDVGYGKTEIAMRAAFRVVLHGKQVKMIVPTTILAMQHWHTFRERMAGFPIRISCLTRFQSASQAHKIQLDLKKGNIDILIGTHAMLSEKFAGGNLGLLIIDEEQKFGVAQKEKIKTQNGHVHVLTMSATPIPRTLHLSLSRIRDISLISTPPLGRKPVNTYIVSDENIDILKEAVNRELQRKGQIFFLHNRIASINDRAHWFMQKTAISASYLIIHARLSQSEIEQRLLEFYRKQADILFSTAIIENGIDIPTVNTLIIDQAERFGLAQLHQLRGRIGRSQRQAYAYLLRQNKFNLFDNERTQSRLLAILDAQSLGGGFKIAMRDLEIRGAGNLVGKEQSGTVNALGYELYIKLLNEAIEQLQNKQQQSLLPSLGLGCEIQLSSNAYLGEEIIPDTFQRMEFYKRFSFCYSVEALQALCEELYDRFGDICKNEPALRFIEREQIRILAQKIGISKILIICDKVKKRAIINFTSTVAIPIQQIIAVAKKNSKRIRFLSRTADREISVVLAPNILETKQLIVLLEEFLKIPSNVATKKPCNF